MLLRTVTGAIITVLVYGVIFFSNIEWVLPVSVSFLSIFALYELFNASGKKNNEILFCLSSFIAFIAPFTGIVKYKVAVAVAFLIALPTFVIFMIWGQKIDFKVLPVAVIVIVLLNAVCGLGEMNNGKYLLYSSVTVCFATDIFAYLGGRLFGKHKLCPKVSPNKTVEGAVCGILFAVLFMLGAGILFKVYFYVNINFKMLALYTVLTSVIGQFGDLAMSSVKRICKIKDFGNVIAGHGGILDRFDSHIFAVSFTYVFSAFTCGFII